MIFVLFVGSFVFVFYLIKVHRQECCFFFFWQENHNICFVTDTV